MSLSSLLVQREVATLREVEEALARQVLYGGDLLLNLFEVARPDERRLAAVLAETHGLEGTSGGVLLPAGAPALALVPSDMARRGVFLPASVEGDQLTVIAAEPLPRALENEISFALGLRLLQRVAPSFRVLEAIARDYGQPLDRRVARLLERLARSEADAAGARADGDVGTEGPRSEPLLGPELAVRAPPRAPSMHPSDPPTGQVGQKKDRRKITEQGFPAVTPEMIAAALRAQSNSQEPPPPNSAVIPSSTSVSASSPPVPLRTPTPPLPDVSTNDTVPRTLAAAPSGPDLGAVTPEGGAEAVPGSGPAVDDRKRAPADGPHTHPTRPTPMSQPPAEIPRPYPPSPNQIVTPIAFPAAREHAPRTEASPAMRPSKQTAPIFTPAQPRRATPFLGTQVPSPVAVVTRPASPAALSATPYMQAPLHQGGRVTHATRPVRPLRRRRGPLVLEGAKRELDEALDRDTVLDVFFDFTRQYVDYAALFIVVGDLAEGRDAFGEGAPRDKVAGIGVPLELPSMLQTARNRRTVVQTVPGSGLGSNRAEGASGSIDEELMADLGRASGSPVVLVPVVVRGRVVALFLGDSGRGGVEVDSLDTISQFAALAGQAFERLIVLRKNARQSVLPPPPPPAPAPPTVAATPAARRDPVPTTRREGRSMLAPPPPSSQSISIQVPLDSKPEPDDDATPIAPGVMSATGEVSFDDALTPIAPSVATSVATVSPREAPASSFAPVTTKREGRDVRQLDARDPFPSPQVDEPPSSRTGRRVSVPPHKPPISKGDRDNELPSVIVDVDPTLLDLVARFVRDGDPEIEAELLRLGQRAMPAIMATFPGPIDPDPERFARLDDAVDPIEPPLRASECGPILRLIAGQRRVAVPFVLATADDPRGEIRFWATFLLLELPYADAATTLLARMFDALPRTRRVARFAARLVAESGPHLFLDYLGRLAADVETEPTMRALAVETLGELRQPRAVPLLIDLLTANDPEIVRTAQRALVVLTCQDFERETRKWTGWWSQNASAHRIEWLIDALVADDEKRAEAAGLELKALTKEYFGFQASLPRRERERSQQRYREWWLHEGRSRFRRE